MPARRSFYDVLTDAVRDITLHGYDSVARLTFWIEEIRKAALADMIPEHVLQERLQSTFSSIYMRMVEHDGLLRLHPEISRFTYDQVKPRLRRELDRRILASADLIVLNRKAAVESTIQRFSGWMTSIPAGGSRAVDKKDVKDNIRKALAQLPFEERRVVTDQGHKFSSELSNILAVDSNAIAAIWHSNWRQMNYNYRKDHKERDLHVYTIRGNWALQQGLMKVGKYGYTDQITKPAEEVFCRCHYEYVYNLASLPSDMITRKGKDRLAAADKKIAALRAAAA